MQDVNAERTDSRPTVYVTRTLPDAVEDRLRRDYDPRLNSTDALPTPADVIRDSRGAQALLPCPTDKIAADTIEQLDSSIRIISTFSVGYEHIDVEAARKRGIVVTNTPDVLTDATADIAMLLILGSARRVHEGQGLIYERTWGAWAPTGMRGIHVTGCRLGILGMGRIGQAVAKRAAGFDLEVFYHNRTQLAPELEYGATYCAELDELLKVSDILSIHCPSTPETIRILNAETISLLPDGAIVVNTARGNVVDDDALIDALKRRKLFSAGLDVFDGEPNIHPGYRDLPNVFLLPHLGSATRATRDAMGFRAVDNLDAYFAGNEPPDRVV